MKAIRTLVFLCALLPGMTALAGNFYVSPTGNNSNPGTFAQPWLTIQFSIDQLDPGDYLFVGDGIYNEKLVFHNDGLISDYITVLASGNGAILDGTGLSLTNAMITIHNHSYIRVQGLEIRNNVMNDAQGILIEGTSQGIQISGNRIHDIHFSANPNDVADETKNAQGIIVFGSSTVSLGNLVIEDNELYNCRLGYSEGIAVNGNVDGFSLTGNFVHDLTNIGIVAIGYEETCSNPSLDQARNGLIARNITSGCHSPYAYCGGIYIDGARNIAVMQNQSSDNDYGIEIGCEHHGKTASEITVRNNVIYDNLAAGIALGGYDPDEAGSVVNASVYNNTLYGNNTGNEMSEIALSVAENVVFKNNIIYQLINSLAISESYEVTNVQYDYNLYYGMSTIVSNIFENTIDGFTFEQFQQSGQETHGICFSDPQFASGAFNAASCMPENMGSASPVINAGDPAYTLINDEFDFFNNNRIEDDRVDIGAAEFPEDLGISEKEDLFAVYPNPANDQLFISTEKAIVSATISDLNGKILLNIHGEKLDSAIDMSDFPSGIYLVGIQTKSGSVSTQKLVKL